MTASGGIIARPTSSARWATIKAVACPNCGAKEGYPCFAKKGGRRKAVHRERIVAFPQDLRSRYLLKSSLRRGIVYFVLAKARDAVKIGFTVRTPQARMRALQTGSSEPLRLLCFVSGTMATERRYHNIFSEQRLEGEWFKFSGPVREYLEGMDW